MRVSAFVKFDCFVADVGLGKHNLNTDTLKVYLTNTLPVATDTVFGTPAEITAEHGYSAGGEDVANTWSQTGGTATLAIGSDIVWTATGGNFGPFQYVVLYNDTSATKPLIGWYNYGSSITTLAGETFTFDMTSSLFTLT
jgi:hypothetical protein